MADDLKQRWRLVLGRYSQETLDVELTEIQQAQDLRLTQLYESGLTKRGHKLTADLQKSSPQALEWLAEIETLFPKSVCEKMQQEAIVDFGLDKLLQEPLVLEKLQPNLGLLKHLLSLGHNKNPAVKAQVHRIIETVVQHLLVKLRPIFERKLNGSINRNQRNGERKLANLDWQKTVRANLKHFDPIKQQMAFQQVYFNSRRQHRLPWHIIVCVDQSCSMSESVIYSVVVAGILHRLPSVSLTLLAFDTAVVDLSKSADDPVKTLLSAQLGGGTYITKAWAVAHEMTRNPDRTVIATVSDFCEGGSIQNLFSQAELMIADGIKMIGMTAMDEKGDPFYDSYTTQCLSNMGMDIAALSPNQFADWLAKKMGFSL